MHDPMRSRKLTVKHADFWSERARGWSYLNIEPTDEILERRDMALQHPLGQNSM